MTDQAERLRTFLDRPPMTAAVAGERPSRVIAVASGKGGVGKTNFVANVGIGLAELGERVLILDADLGLANLDVVCGLTPRWTLEHVIGGQKDLQSIAIDGPGGVKILPAPRGKPDLTALSEGERLHLLAVMDEFEGEFDTMLIDTGAGIASNVRYFASAAHEIIVIATPEPTSITDAYALIKVLHQEHGEDRFRLVVNNVGDEREAMAVYQNLTAVADRYLNVSLQFTGHVVRDASVERAVIRQQPVLEAFGESAAAESYRRVARTLRESPRPTQSKGGLQFFFRRFMSADATPTEALGVT